MSNRPPLSREASSREASEDELRARELYKYFRPPAKDGESPDPILTAHAQLVAWRLHAERSMITLIDEEIQYFVAESTKTLHLDNANEHEHPDDAIWAGCVRVTKAGRLCEHTIAASPPESGGPACFEVLDLTKDARFNTLDFVTGPPNFRNYAGVPLRTRKGINIGSIFVIDSKIRPPLTTAEKNFLGMVASNVIQHLEMLRDKKGCARALNMSACMSAYVDPLHKIAPPESQRDSKANASLSSPSVEDRTDARRKTGNIERMATFKRAAEFLLKGLDFDESGGGVMFLDTFSADFDFDHSADESPGTSSGQESDENIDISLVPRGFGNPKQPTSRPTGRGKGSKGMTSTEILAHAIQPAKNVSKTEPPVAHINALPPKDLFRLVKRYPEGKLFTFNSQGHVLTSSSEESSRHHSVLKSSRTYTRTVSKQEMDKLRNYFPTARQVIFLPIWDSSTSRWAVCIAYHASRFRNLSYKSEFVYCATFGNTIVAELTKVAVVQADRQKSDFIASISHELRSPLHGILASCEFLDDTETTPFQQSLIGTADSCARTLLDTINMVLDYSNINRFEKKTDSVKNNRRDVSSTGRSKALQARLSTQRTVDVAALVEEVVDGIVAGHAYGGRVKRGTPSTTDTIPTTAPRIRISNDVSFKNGCVEVIVDIPHNDWTFYTEPGALRRIIMNLVENGIKFTQDGFVHVKVESNELEGSAAFPFIILTITDSGQGISPAYLRDTAFSSFSQESNLTAGVGLGLSLVKSIVRNMGGKISIDSTIGTGTRAVVKLPVARTPKKKKNVDPEQFDNTAERNRSVAINAVKVKAQDRMAALHWPEPKIASNSQGQALRLLQSSLMMYLSRWFGVSCSPWQQDTTYDIVITTFDGLNALADSTPELFTENCQSTVLAIGNATSPSPLKFDIVNSGNVFVVECPFGPSKLAHVLARCLSKPKSVKRAHNNEAKNDEEPPRTHDPSKDYVRLEADLSPADSELINNDGPESLNGTTNPAAPNTQPVNTMDLTFIEPSLISTDMPVSEPVQKPEIVADPIDHSPRMLLVDDNAINLRLLKVYAKKLGHKQVHAAENGQVALDTYNRLLHATPSTPPNVILMDLSMPVMDGFEATRRIRQSEADYKKKFPQAEGAPPRSLIIALTGLASLKDQKEAFAAGVDRYMMKPVSFAKLTILLEKWQSNDLGDSHKLTD